MSRALGLLGLVAVLGASAAALYPLCDVLHRCGCKAPWAGGVAHCNVWNEGGPHCPWCEYPALGAVPTLGAMGSVVVVFLALRRRRRGVAAAAGAAFLALPSSLLVLGAGAWLLTDYPHFLVEDARSRLGLPGGPLRCVVPAAKKAAAPCCGPTSPPKGR